MAFPTTSVLDNFNRADENPITTNWTAPIELGATAQMLYVNRIGGWGSGQAYYDIAEFGPDCEAYVQLETVPPDGYNLRLWTNINGEGTASVTCYRCSIYSLSGTWYYGIRRINAGITTHLEVDQPVGHVFVNGDWYGMEVIDNIISLYYKTAAGSWTKFAEYDDSSSGSKITTAGWIGITLDHGLAYGDNFGGGTISTVTLDSMLPDADIASTGWSTAPLYSKINDDSDATVIQATAS